MAMGLVAVSTAYAASTYYVDASWVGTTPGNDPDGAGSATSFGTDSFATIQEAVTAASIGDTVQVAAGTYSETVTVATANLTLKGAGDSTLISVSGGGTALTVSANGITLSSLKINKGDALDEDDGKGIEAGATISSLTLSSVTVTGATVGFRVGSGVTIDGLTVSGSHFDGNDMGWYFAKETSASAAATITNVNVTNTTFNNNLRKGVYAEKLDNALFDGVTVSNSGTSGTYGFNNGIDINLKWGTYSNIELRNTTVTGSGLLGGATLFDPAGITIKARDDGSYATPGATLTTVTLNNVTVSGGVVGVRFGEQGKNNASPTGVVVSSSSLSGTGGLGLINQTQASVTATNTWWGSASGPGSATSGVVSTTPWCVVSGCSTLSNNANLVSLSLSSGTLSPAFSSSTTSYTASVGNSVTSVTVNRTVHPGSSSTATGSTALVVGSNTVTVTVTSAGGTTKTYTVTVTRDSAPVEQPVPTPTPTATPPPVKEPGNVSVPVKDPVKATVNPDVSTQVQTTGAGGSTAKVTVPPSALPSTTPANVSVRVAAVADPVALRVQAPPPARAQVVVDFVVNLVVSATVDGETEDEVVEASFDQPVALEFTLSASQIPQGSTTDTIILAFWNGSDWVEVDAVVSLNADGSYTLIGNVNHFTLFSVFISPPGWGTFTVTPYSTGVTLTRWVGGGYARLIKAVGEDNSVWIYRDGHAIGYIVGAPAFANARFVTMLPDGVPPEEPVAIVRH